MSSESVNAMSEPFHPNLERLGRFDEVSLRVELCTVDCVEVSIVSPFQCELIVTRLRYLDYCHVEAPLLRLPHHAFDLGEPPLV